MIIETQDKKIIDTEKENSDLQALVAEDLHSLYLKYAKLGISFYAVVPPDKEKNIKGFFTRNLMSQNGMEIFQAVTKPIANDLYQTTKGEVLLVIMDKKNLEKFDKMMEGESQ